MFKGFLSWLNGLKQVDWDCFEGAFNEGKATSEGEVTMSPAINPLSNFLTKEEHISPFYTPIDRDTKIKKGECTSRKSPFPLDGVGPTLVIIGDVEIALGDIDLLSRDRFIICKASL